MEPANIRFGGGANETVLHPLIAVWMLIAVVLILILPRNKAVVPFLLAAFTIPLGQVILVGGLHFPVLRILILAGLARMISSSGRASNRFPRGMNAIDVVVALWTVSGLVIVSVQWMDPQATIKFLGDFIDALGGYLVVRFLISNREAVRRAVKALAWVCVINGAFMVSEQFTRHNVLSFLGAAEPTIRDGHIRSEGVLGTLYGGVFAGVLIPIFLWLWREQKSRIVAGAGLTGATAMVYASYASTSVMAYAAGLGGLGFWLLRGRMRIVRWAIVAMLVGLHLVMNGPVWSLIEHVDMTRGSSSYHRYMLIDTLIRHFGEWWLFGTRNNASWGWQMWDTCNQFVAVAVTGGLLTLILYIMILKRSFAVLGKARKRARGNHRQEWFLWCLGSCLFANVVAQFGINYMVQLQLLLFVLLAYISVAVFEVGQATLKEAEALDSGRSPAQIAPL
jgi:hypothetical protein